jgi:alkaline phosphatase
MKEGRQFVEEKIRSHNRYFGVDASAKNKKTAKNVVFLIGDGMGISTITAGRIYVGSTRNQSIPEKGPLSFDSFPFTSLLKVSLFESMVIIFEEHHELR